AVILIGGGSCGSSPTAPSSPLLPNGPGPYHLKMTGFITPADPAVAPCVGAVTDPSYVRVYLDIAREGTGWVGRTTTQPGDLALSIQSDGAGVGGTSVIGSIKGTAIDTAYPFGLRGLHPEFALTIKVGAATGSAGSVK